METKYKIFIVDDDKFLLSMYAMKFAKSGLEVMTATGSDEALAKFKEGAKPDILILDVIMPGMDGLELLTLLRKDKTLPPETTVVVLTNQGETSDIEKAKNLGVQGYIVKATAIPSEVVEEVMKIFKNNKKS